jgi:ribosomal protein S18 acetylase RimI-like enzyme
VNVCDWRDAGPEVLTPLYEHGRRNWLATLGWDIAGTLAQLEQARTTWGLPGLLALDETGCAHGWSFFLPQDNVLHVGGLTAQSGRAADALVDALIQVSEDAGADAVSCFMFEEAPDVARVLARRGFETEPFLYLSRDLAPVEATGGPSATHLASWERDDIEPAADLLRAVYRPEAAKYFAPGHTSAAWARYLRHLVEQSGVGRFNRDATRILRGASGIEALVLATAVSSETAHLAQVAVHPSRRREGLATRLVLDASAIAARQGYTRITLLVGASNTSARQLYADMKFSEGPRFVAAYRGTS